MIIYMHAHVIYSSLELRYTNHIGMNILTIKRVGICTTLESCTHVHYLQHASACI